MRIRYYLRLTFAFLARFRGVLLISLVLGLFLFFGLQFVYPSLIHDTQRIGITGRYHSNNLPDSILDQIGEGLTKINASGQVEPALAQSWVSEDQGKTWIFKLKKDITWQDGEKVVAQDIRYSFEDVKISTPDGQTIIFELESPFAPFPAIVAKPAFKKGLLGTGSWRVTKISLAGTYVQRLDLKDREGNRQVIKFYPTEERTKLAFQLGEVDIVQNLINPSPFDEWQTVQVEDQTAQQRVVGIFFNTQEGPLAEKGLRQALSYAVDKDAFGQRALGPVAPDSWVYNPQVKPYEFSPDRAKELLSDLPDEVRESLEIKLVTTPALLEIAEKVAGYWQEVGITTSVQVTSTLPSEYQAFLAIYDIPKDPDQYSTWHSTQVETNISNYSNPRIDKLLEDGRQELDEDERKKIYLDFQRFLLEDAPALFLYHPSTYTVSRN